MAGTGAHIVTSTSPRVADGGIAVAANPILRAVIPRPMSRRVEEHTGECWVDEESAKSRCCRVICLLRELSYPARTHFSGCCWDIHVFLRRQQVDEGQFLTRRPIEGV